MRSIKTDTATEIQREIQAKVDALQIVSLGGASRRNQLKAKTKWDNDDYCTPYEIKAWLKRIWRGRGIGVDPCGNKDSILEPFIEYRLDKGQDGLTWNWFFEHAPTVFVNPPYSRVMPWLRRASWLAAKHPDIQIVFLIPPVVASQFWRRWVWGIHDPTMTAKMRAIPAKPASVVHMWGQPRLCFLKNGEVETQPRGDSALVLYAGVKAEPKLLAAYLRNQPQGFRLKAVSGLG